MYPAWQSAQPKKSVMRVAKTVLLMNFWNGVFSLPSEGVKSSCQDMRPMRATASTDVRAKADTHIVRMQAAMSAGTPKMLVRKPATEVEKSANGVPFGSAPPSAAAGTPR